MAAQNQVPEVESYPYDSSGPLFSMYLERAEEEDKKMAESWKGDAEGMLVFVSAFPPQSFAQASTQELQTGLFSATVATLLSISIQYLQPNCQDTSAFYLANIYQLLSNENGSHVVILPPSLTNPTASFTAPASAVWVNSLWFSSLVISLTCALLATLLQQWARRYLRVTKPRYSPRKRARIRTFFAEGVTRLHLNWTVDALTTLLHISLFFFFTGLCVFLFGIHPTVFKVTIAWVGLCFVIYAYVTALPIVYKDSPYHAPLSTVIWLCAASVRYTVFPTHDNTHHNTAMPGGLFPAHDPEEDPREDHPQGLFPSNLLMRAEEYASGLPSDIDHRALSWTFDSLDEDDDLEQFFDRVPGFCSSSALDNPMGSFIGVNRKKLSSALAGLMDRTLPSSLVPESVKQRRITICTRAISAARLFGPWWILTRVLGEWQAFLRSADFGLFLKDWSRVDRPITTYYSQCAVAVIISSVQAQARDDRWVQLVVRQINVSKSSVQSYLTHGDSILLANLVYITGQTFLASSHIGRHCESLIKDASSIALESICTLDARNSLPELQHDFCKLWNELVHAARHGEYLYIRNLSLSTLKNIRKVYIALHEGVDDISTVFASIDDSDATLDDISSYPMCTMHVHDSALPGGSPNLQGQASAVVDAAQLPISPAAALPSPASMMSTTSMTFPSPSPSPPVSSTAQALPVRQGPGPTDQCTIHVDHSAPQAS